MDDLKSAALVVSNKVLHIFQHKGWWLVVIENLRNGEEEVSLLLVLEAVFAPETVLFRYAREAEWLAWETATENVELRNVGDGHRMDVAVRFFTKVGGIGLLAELIPVAGEDTSRPGSFKGDSEPADAAEEVDKFEAISICIPAHLIRRQIIPEHTRWTAVGNWRPRSFLTLRHLKIYLMLNARIRPATPQDLAHNRADAWGYG